MHAGAATMGQVTTARGMTHGPGEEEGERVAQRMGAERGRGKIIASYFICVYLFPNPSLYYSLQVQNKCRLRLDEKRSIRVSSYSGKSYYSGLFPHFPCKMVVPR